MGNQNSLNKLNELRVPRGTGRGLSSPSCPRGYTPIASRSAAIGPESVAKHTCGDASSAYVYARAGWPSSGGWNGVKTALAGELPPAPGSALAGETTAGARFFVSWRAPFKVVREAASAALGSSRGLPAAAVHR